MTYRSVHGELDLCSSQSESTSEWWQWKGRGGCEGGVGFGCNQGRDGNQGRDQWPNPARDGYDGNCDSKGMAIDLGMDLLTMEMVVVTAATVAMLGSSTRKWTYGQMRTLLIGNLRRMSDSGTRSGQIQPMFKGKNGRIRPNMVTVVTAVVWVIDMRMDIVTM